MNFKQFDTSDNQWHDIPYYQHKTATDTLTLPAVIYPNASTVTVGLKGNTVQNGTPTPDNPIMPQGTGERTKNLVDVANLSNVKWATQYPLLLAAINSLPNGVYTMSISFELTSRNDTTDSSACGWYIAKGSSVLSNIRQNWNRASIGTVKTVSGTFTIDDNNRGSLNTLYLYGCGMDTYGATGSANTTKIMLNSGSTALPYEPYGYKIPISSAGQTTPVYLGEVQTTRRVKKLVLTGDEVVTEYTGYGAKNCFFVKSATPPSIGYCNVYINVNELNTWIATDNSFHLAQSYIRIHDGRFSVASELKEYLAQQYANGTPVTVWYVLATPETGIVNEPLMKIGDYADSLTTSIPCTAGENTLDVQTTVAPSEVTATFEGWHPITEVHERENGEWD